MAIITLDKKLFEKEIGTLDSKMQERIAMFGTPIEKIDDKEIQLEIFPNRPDMLSYQGFKRSFLAFLDKKTGLRKYEINKPKKNYLIKIDSSVKNIRPYTACAIVEGLKLDDEKIKELIEIQEKLHLTLGRKRKKVAIGIYPLEKIKLPITFKALEPEKIKFIPLESTKEMSGLEILQKHPAGKEYSHLLAGKIKFPVFVDSEKNILSMPPIINSQSTGKITENTTEVFVECSGFDFSVLNKCLNIIVTAFADMGGKVYQMEIQGIKGTKKTLTPNLSHSKIKINLENVNKILGLNLNEKEMKKFLEKMGHNFKDNFVEIAPWRVDVLHEIDLIEDIAIAYGYENFIPEIPEISTIGNENKKEKIKRKISEVLAGLGMLEISNYHLTIEKDQSEKMGIKSKQGNIEVKKSKTDYNVLRKNLSHYILKIFSENVDSEYPQKIFESGKIFSLENNKIEEKEHLSAGITPGNFTEIRQILEYLMRMIGVKIYFKSPENKNFPFYFIDGRIAEIFLEDIKLSEGEGGRGVAEGQKQISIGFVGEIHPRILKNWKLKMPVALFEINLEEIFNELKEQD